MIDLTKNYKTKHGCDVVLYEIVDERVFGRWYTVGKWYGCNWYSKNGGLYQEATSAMDLIEVPEFRVISEVVREYKTVTYFGFDISVPVWVNYIATESDGTVIGFSKSPVLGVNDLFWNNTRFFEQRSRKVLSITFDGDWRKSLMKIK